MSKQFVAILVVVILGLFGVFALTKKSSNTNNGSTDSAQASEHKVGAGTKGVTLIEYGDFECPACKQFHPLLKQLKETYGDEITFQFRNFPLTQIHPHAFAASRAAEAAGKQGKFFEMHDLLYENQGSWAAQSGISADQATTIFDNFAKQLGLNIEQFKTDMNSAEVAAVINADIKAGQEIGAKSTPTFVLNGKKLDKNPQSLDEFKKLIDEEIAKAQPSN